VPPAWAAPPVQAPAATPAEPAELQSAQSPEPGLAPAPAAAPTVPAEVTEAQITRRVMADLQGQLDLMLEVRVRETLAPILARAGDAIVRDARKELTAALREIVSLSVCRELRRRDDT
jgi:phage gp29-like protein